MYISCLIVSLKKHIFFYFFALCIIFAQSQIDCVFKADTVFVPKENKVLNATYLQTTFKNKTNFYLYKANNNKYYIKFVVTENLYFGKVDLLELKSGTKSFYAKETTHYQLDKNTGYYVFEIYKNYIGTLKDDGLTSINFGKAETIYSKQDCNQVKQLAKCFYQSIDAKPTTQKN